jgi:hypothetical protein
MVLPDQRILYANVDSEGGVTVRDLSGSIVAEQTRHGEQVNGIVPVDNQTVVSWTHSGNMVRIWRLEPEDVHRLPGHSDRINGVLELPGERLLTWSNDNTLKIWEMDGSIRTTMEHSFWVNHAAVHPDGYIVSCSDDMHLGVWTMDGKCYSWVQGGGVGGVKHCQILSDGTILAFMEPTIGLFEVKDSSNYFHCTVDGTELPMNIFEEQDFQRKYRPSRKPMETQSGSLVVEVDRRDSDVLCRWENKPLRWHGETIVRTAGISTSGLVIAMQENGQLCILEAVVDA